ncbi:hypothetical protein L207DRAFT_394586, partial [Hyaloscypha variabilis F]
MSFGYSVGDFVAIGQLAWTVYKSCKGAPGEFQELARELSTLHTILHELEDEAKTPTSLLNRRGAERKPELEALLANGLLDELVRDIREGSKEPTIVSTYEDDDELAWNELERELVGDGITREDVRQYKEEIRNYLRRL